MRSPPARTRTRYPPSPPPHAHYAPLAAVTPPNTHTHLTPGQASTQSESPSPEDHASIVALVQAQDYAPLLAADQLGREMREGRVFTGFVEAPVAFPPTFKVVRGAARGCHALKLLLMP